MTIIRSPRVQRDFTIVSNSVCLDPRLSMRALGLLLRLLCRPDNWKTNSETLAREFGVGRDQIRGVLKELVGAGYMTLSKQQDAAGHWTSHWSVFDEPTSASDTGEPKPGLPAPGNPYFGDSGAIPRTDLTSTDNKPPTPKGEHAPPGFSKFWECYPSTRKVGKKSCMDKWRRKGLEVKADEIIGHVEAMKRTKAWAEGFDPSPQTYLAQERWGDGVPDDAQPADGGIL